MGERARWRQEIVRCEDRVQVTEEKQTTPQKIYVVSASFQSCIRAKDAVLTRVAGSRAVTVVAAAKEIYSANSPAYSGPSISLSRGGGEGNQKLVEPNIKNSTKGKKNHNYNIEINEALII